MLCEMQSVRSRIWTHVAVSNSCDDNHYTTGVYYTQEINLNFLSGYLHQHIQDGMTMYVRSMIQTNQCLINTFVLYNKEIATGICVLFLLVWTYFCHKLVAFLCEHVGAFSLKPCKFSVLRHNVNSINFYF